MSELNRLRIVGSAGANRAMEAELKRLAPRYLKDRRLPKAQKLDGQQLTYPFDKDLAWLAVHYLRTPSRIFWDLVEFPVDRLVPLYEAIFEWAESAEHPWMLQDGALSVIVRKSDEFGAGPLQIRGTVKNALLEATQKRGITMTLDPDTPDVIFTVEARLNSVLLSIDLAGKSLHQRGYRLLTSEAPLKETLASQMLILSRWDSRKEVLLDPMAGAGTIPIEGAAMALGTSTWHPRRRGLAAELSTFSDYGDSPLEELFPGQPPLIIANELHTPSFKAMEDNLQRFPGEHNVLTQHGDFRDLNLDKLLVRYNKHREEPIPDEVLDHGLMIVNPPYGERLKEGRGIERDLLMLYEDLYDYWHSLGRGWRLALLCAHIEVKRIFGLQPRLEKSMRNGQISAQLLVYEQE